MNTPPLFAPTAARYVYSLRQLLHQAGEPVDNLLDGTGVQAEALQRPGQFVHHDALDRFLLNIEQQTRITLPGLLLGHHLNISAHGAVGYAGLTTPNAGRAIEVAARYFPLITSLVKLDLHHTSQCLQLQVIPAAGISSRAEQFVVHTLLASFDVMGRFLVGDLELRVALTFPEQEALNQRLSPAIRHIAFNQPCASFTIPKARLDIPFALADQTAHAQAIKQCESELKTLNGQKSLAGTLRQLLVAGPPADQETIAAQLGMSSRTLHRRLQRDGVSFRDLVQQARIQQAKHYLTYERLSVTETAYRLGYQDSANFTRSFRNATGMTPSEFSKK
ncbi:helix-turn-helix transcriptional regulator [Marinobacter sp. SS21]|uniref:helix-turn-helix transcriptional regulator n=1 Tax=Marinobacter sp. SS21 TaxID=2979460 RepID=UPI00233057A5|nr:AraC family transcriptional regulator [Marinobacter sp. SS21]MDC0661402.1 AraC family transcriptional regulator ligand-binding domain-containing protein [Marinobacter sp. SS21]